MNIPSSMADKLVLVAAIGGVVAVNILIIGLVLIAVVHDGNTAQQIASSFQAALTALIGVAGTIVGSIFTGRIVHSATLSAQQETTSTVSTVAPLTK